MCWEAGNRDGDVIIRKIKAFLNEKNLSCKVQRIGIPDIYIEQGSSRQLRRKLGIDTETVLKCAAELDR